MAIVDQNNITEGLSGKLGKRLVFRTTKKGNTILALSPIIDPDRVQNEGQLAIQSAFTRATSYAKSAKTQPLYVKLAKASDEDVSGYNLAVADWFGQPEIMDVDRNGWTGQMGHAIRIQARDDTQVTSVQVRMQDADGTLLEQGQAVPSEMDALWWIYTTTSEVVSPTTCTFVVTAKDLPGNTTNWSGKIVS